MTVIVDYILSQTLKILYLVRLFNLGETIHYVPGKLRACRFLARFCAWGKIGYLMFYILFVYGVEIYLMFQLKFCAGVTNFFIPENGRNTSYNALQADLLNVKNLEVDCEEIYRYPGGKGNRNSAR